MFEPLFREAQHQVLQYRSGNMAVIAVPGSGKTFILTHLAATLIKRLSTKDIERGREILLVTFSNSAAKNIQNRIEALLGTPVSESQKTGYRIRTIHGLARDIISERPSLVGLTDDFRILNEQVTEQIIQEATLANLPAFTDAFDDFMASSIQVDEKRLKQIHENSLPELATQVSRRFIKHCKDHLISAENLPTKNFEYPILQFAVQVYANYQQRLSYRSAVDFDDLVMLALTALQNDDTLKNRLHKRWVHILEDEAQDSSALQEKLLRLLSGDENWVRVGDPNQSINSTFTAADPQFLRAFTEEAGVTTIDLNQSGRSGRPIIDFANALVKWTIQLHPVREVRESFDSRMIEPARIGDPDVNPATNETNIFTFYQPGKDISPDQELQVVMQSLKRWLPDHPDKTVAVLVPENRHGYQFSEMLRQANLPYDELLRTTSDIRQALKVLLVVLNYLCDPVNPNLLATVYRDVWWTLSLGGVKTIRTGIGTDAIKSLPNDLYRAIAQFKNVETFLYPQTEDANWSASFTKFPSSVRADMELFRQQMKRWLNAFYLPADQLVLTIGRDVFHDSPNLKITYQIASFLHSFEDLDTRPSLRDLTNELKAISENQRRYLDLDEMSVGYQPTPGVVTVSTLHSAKGLEWDRVYILGVNSRSFPDAQDSHGSSNDKWFIRDQLNLEAEVIAMLDSAFNDTRYREGEATENARIAYASERLRLLYVGITRAKQEVILLWNMGHQWRQSSTVAEPALALKVLTEYLEGSLSF